MSAGSVPRALVPLSVGHSTPPPLEDLVSPERSLGVRLIWVPCSLLAKEWGLLRVRRGPGPPAGAGSLERVSVGSTALISDPLWFLSPSSVSTPFPHPLLQSSARVASLLRVTRIT